MIERILAAADVGAQMAQNDLATTESRFAEMKADFEQILKGRNELLRLARQRQAGAVLMLLTCGYSHRRVMGILRRLDRVNGHD